MYRRIPQFLPNLLCGRPNAAVSVTEANMMGVGVQPEERYMQRVGTRQMGGLPVTTYHSHTFGNFRAQLLRRRHRLPRHVFQLLRHARLLCLSRRIHILLFPAMRAKTRTTMLGSAQTQGTPLLTRLGFALHLLLRAVSTTACIPRFLGIVRDCGGARHTLHPYPTQCPARSST
jgi:hypothetical protein